MLKVMAAPNVLMSLGARKIHRSPFLDRGELVAVLETYSAPFPGLYLYYPQRRQASPALRALLDHLRHRSGR